MKYTHALLIAALLVGCGGSGGDASSPEADQRYQAEAEPAATQAPNTITCEHDGDILICDEENSCTRDQSTSEVAAAERLANGSYAVLFTSGNITIIAECGSSVSIDSSESTSTTEGASGVSG